MVFPRVKITKEKNDNTTPPFFFWVTCTQHHHNLFHNVCPKLNCHKLNILGKKKRKFGCFKIDYNPIQVWVSISVKKDDFTIKI